MKIDWIAKLRHLLQTQAFCLAISAIQYSFQPERGYEVPLVYSVGIGAWTWLLIDFGRHLFPSSAETGWPQGVNGIVLCAAGIAAGYALGTLTGDGWFGWSSWAGEHARSQLRVSVLITVLAGIGVTYYFYNANKSAYLQRKMVEARQQASETRLKLLEAQLEPHMLFNTLANLRALIATDPARATVMLDHLNSYLRATLSGSRATTHPLAAEFARLADYLALMAVRMGPRLACTLELPDALREVPVPPLLLQPLVENAIKHGLEPKVEGGRITVRARREGDTLHLEVADTGVGLRGGIQGSDGFGLAQVRERLATACGPAARLELTDNTDQGTLVALQFPLKS